MRSTPPEADAAVFRTANWDVLKPSRKRRQIDNTVFHTLRLTKCELDAVYEAVSELITNRLKRARST